MATNKVNFPFNKELSKKTYNILNFLYAKFIKPTFRVKQTPKLITKILVKDDKLIFKVELDLTTIHSKDRDDIDTYINKLKGEVENN